MTALVLVLLAGSALATPPAAAVAATRLRGLVPAAGASATAAAADRAPASTALSEHPERVLAVSACLGASLGVMAEVWATHGGPASRLVAAPAFAGGVAAVTVARSVIAAAAERAAQRTLSALVAAVTLLAADLRAGQSPPAALRGAAAVAIGVPLVHDIFATAADAATRGQGVAQALRGGCRQPPGARSEKQPRDSASTTKAPQRAPDGLTDAAFALRGLAAAWQVCESSGAAPGSVLDAVAADLRAGQRHHQQLAAQLAGARSTVGLLAGLPVLGFLLGAGMGANPSGVLLGTPGGQTALVTGVVLDAIGMFWSDRIVAAAIKVAP